MSKKTLGEMKNDDELKEVLHEFGRNVAEHMRNIEEDWNMNLLYGSKYEDLKSENKRLKEENKNLADAYEDMFRKNLALKKEIERMVKDLVTRHG